MRNRLVIAAAVLAVLGAAALLVDLRDRETQVRDACREFLEACADRDLEEVWDLPGPPWLGTGGLPPVPAGLGVHDRVIERAESPR